MDICKTDVRTIVKYLNDAAVVYDLIPSQRAKCRAHMIRRLNRKLNKKLEQNYEERRHGQGTDKGNGVVHA